MPRTEVSGGQIKDGGITIDDLDLSTSGKAIITKIVAGSNITIDSSTGPDAGTGTVTISGADSGQFELDANSDIQPIA